MIALETSYAGCRFRSRLEARWAVFFDTLGIRWEYEPQGFALPSGPYLPDFRLKLSRGDAWFEVKPPRDAHERHEPDARWRELAESSGMMVYVVRGLGRFVVNGKYFLHPDTQVHMPDGRWDCQHDFCMCAMCGAKGLEIQGRAGRLCACSGTECDDGFRDDERIQRAYVAALSARFEFGESGAPWQVPKPENASFLDMVLWHGQNALAQPVVTDRDRQIANVHFQTAGRMAKDIVAELSKRGRP